MPINQYMFETFDDKNNKIRTENQYYMSINLRKKSQVLIELSPEYNDIEIKIKNFSNISVTYATGFKKYRIWQSDNDNVYFNVTNPRKRNANYMIRYYYSEITLEYTYIFDDNVEKKVFFPNEQYATVYLTFNSIKIKIVNEPLDSNIISFSINGLLYKSNDNSEELFNTTSILYERIPIYQNQTKHIYSLNNPEKWTLIFENIPRENNFVYDLQLQVNSIIYNNIFNEEFLIFTTKVNLTDIKPVEEKNYTWTILGIVFGVLLALLITFFIIKYIRLQRSNLTLREEMKSMAYSNDVQKNVINRERQDSERDNDYESAFI